MRRAIANALYGLARRADRPSSRWSYGYGYWNAGVMRYETPDVPGIESVTTSYHARDETRVEVSFRPSEYGPGSSYSALHVGSQREVTIFLNPRLVHRMIAVLTDLDAKYREYGS